MSSVSGSARPGLAAEGSILSVLIHSLPFFQQAAITCWFSSVRIHHWLVRSLAVHARENRSFSCSFKLPQILKEVITNKDTGYDGVVMTSTLCNCWCLCVCVLCVEVCVYVYYVYVLQLSSPNPERSNHKQRYRL